MGDTLMREATRDELRKALLDHLTRDHDRSGADLVEEVSLEVDATRRRVLAAMWALVEDGEIHYEAGARLRLPY